MSPEAEFVDHPSGFLALSPRNIRFAPAGHRGFIAYRKYGHTRFLFGGVHAPAEERGALLDLFLAAAQRHGCGVVAVQVRREQCELFAARGFTVNSFGQTFAARLDGFSLAGASRVKLRNKIKRARAAGLVVQEVGRELPRDEQTFARLRAVSAAWLREKGKPELEFMIGELGEVAETRRRFFVASDSRGNMRGFISYVPAWGARQGYLHDLTRRTPDAPPGTMELINAEAIARLRGEGAAYLHLGFTPFIVAGPEPAGASKVVGTVLRLLGRHGRRIYPAQSQIDYKHKWGPDIVEDEMLAFRPLSPRAVLDLLKVTRSL